MRSAALLALLLIAACDLAGAGGDDVAVRLTTDRGLYAPPDTLVLRLENQSSQPIGVNLCTAELERRSDAGGWAPVLEDRICTRELRILEPGQTATAQRALSGQTVGGLSRLRLRLGGPGEAVVFSNAFQIVAVRR